MTFAISCVVVLFKPARSVVDLVRTLASGGYGVVVVVNAADESILCEIREIKSAFVLDNKGNVGLATALNLGIRHAFDSNGADYVALFDQDSVPDAAMPRDLVNELLSCSSVKVACIGPMLLDRKDRDARYASNARQSYSGSPFSIPTSGTVIPKRAYELVGPMMDELFIDGIDHEWCLRAWSKGYTVMVSTRSQMLHDMGDASLNYFGQYKPIHRSPIRHYYIVRNAIFLSKVSYLPMRWRVVELLKMLRRMVAYLAVSSDRRRTLRLLGWAIFDGFRSRMGPCKV